MADGIFLSGSSGGGIAATDLPFGPLDYLSGGYYGIHGLPVNSGGSTVNNELRLGPIWVGNDVTFDRIAIYHWGSVSSAGVFRMGVYRFDSTTSWSLVLDAGTVPMDTATGKKEITISMSLSQGIYMIGGAGQGIGSPVPTISRVDVGSSRLVDFMWPKGQTANISTPCRGFVRSGISGALPSTLTVGLSDLETSVDQFFMWLRAQ